MKNDKHDLQNTTQKTKVRATGTTDETWINSGFPEGVVVLAPIVAPVVLLLLLLNNTNIM